MVMVHKIVHGTGELQRDTWFENTTERRLTRAVADPLNVQARIGHLELRRGFFSNRIVNDWNNVPGELKNLVTGKFKEAYKRQRKAYLMADN
jgi:hypothetical protein